MDFKQIEAFVNVIKYSSFSKAADALFLTQPTISMHINSLEQELGVTLINRRGKEVSPTGEGKKLYRYATDMMNTRARAIAAVRNSGNTTEGVLEIQSSSIPGEYIVPRLIAEFSREYPKMKYFLEQSDSGRVMENIASGKGELGFTGTKGPKSLRYTLLLTDKTVIITPKSERFLELGEDVSFETFANEPFIQRESGSATLKTFEEALPKLAPRKNINVIARMNSMEAVKQAVSAGLGVAAVSETAIWEERHNQAFFIFRPRDLDIGRTFYMVYNDRISLSPPALLFKNFVLNKLKISD